MVSTIQEGVIINMFVKKIKRKCRVRGCNNIADVYAISKRRDIVNTVIMCRGCMADALKSTEPQSEVTLSSVADVEPEPEEAIDTVTEDVPSLVTEDTVAIKETPKPIVNKPKPKTTANGKKKPNKKK